MDGTRRGDVQPVGGKDADRFPNGPPLISDVQKVRGLEVNPAGEKVWQLEIRQPNGDQNLHTVFLAKRIPELSPVFSRPGLRTGLSWRGAPGTRKPV
jgi:hypothetical protein